MKKLIVVITAALLLVSPVAFTGCQSPPTTAYKVTNATYVTVDAAMAAWGEYVRVYKPGLGQERKVNTAFKTWQKASVAVIDTARAAQASDGTSQAKVNAAVAAAAAALNGLIDVLGSFGITLTPKG
jgi:hypothetical protein